MKKIMIICLVALMAIAGTTAALASANFRDGEEGPEENATHVEGLESISPDEEANEGAHTEGNDEGIVETTHNEDEEEGTEANTNHPEGSEAIGEDSKSEIGDNDSFEGNGEGEDKEDSHKGDND